MIKISDFRFTCTLVPRIQIYSYPQARCTTPRNPRASDSDFRFLLSYFRSYFIFVLLLLVSCQQVKDRSNTQENNYKMGAFSDDLDFISSNTEVVLLKDKKGESYVITTPELQGRVLTSSFNGMEGKSLGYVDHERIASSEVVPHTQGYGGEDRFWIGPQGGQYTIYFNPGDAFNFENWFTPASLDTEPFKLVSANDSSVHYSKRMKLKNYVNTEFDLEVNRRIRIIEREEASKLLGLNEINDLKYVGFESNNEMKNVGEQTWKKETGLLSIWILGMFPGGSTVLIPYKEGPEGELGPVYNEYFDFNKLDENQIQAREGTIFYNGSGNYIGKIGVGANRAKPFLGSYDSKNGILTIVHYSISGDKDYVNSQWEEQEFPYAGDVVNAYNDGPLDRNQQVSPTFYELESSSPAKELEPGESIFHLHKTFHFSGDKEELNPIAESLLGASIEEIEIQF